MAATASSVACPLPAHSASFAAPTEHVAVQVPPVINVVGQHGTVVCLGDASLADAADLLISHNRTAAGVVDASGAFLGALTENDILQAYVLGVRPLATVGEWLQSGHARMPASKLRELTIAPGANLLDAASLMRAHAWSDCAARHLVVAAESGFVGILSCLDLARALHSLAPQSELMQRVGREAVAEVMKPRAALPACSSSTSLGEVLQRMVSSHRNCALIVDGASPKPVGLITPRDALRAFSEHVPLDTAVGHWLRGLQATWEPRMVAADAPLSEAAAIMAENNLHHLAVASATGATASDRDISEMLQVVGVVSSTDLAQIVGMAPWILSGRTA